MKETKKKMLIPISEELFSKAKKRHSELEIGLSAYIRLLIIEDIKKNGGDL